MKIILTESQLRKILNEQMGHKSFMGPNYAHYKNNPSGFVSDTQKWMDGIVSTAEDPVFWEIMGIAFAFVPYIGIPLAMGAELNAARLYKEKGDNFNATVTGILALLPLVGKIPGVKQVTSSFLQGIKDSIKKGVELTVTQSKYLTQLLSKQTFIKSKINEIKKLIDGIDKAAVDKANRMLEQKLKFVGDDIEKVTKIYQEYVDGLRKVKYEKGIIPGKGKGNPGGSLGTGGPAGNTRVYTNANIKGKKLTAKQIQYIVRHEVDHIYRNSPEEAKDWLKAFDINKIGSSYFRNPQPLPNQVGFGFKKYNTWDEIRARASQLKDFISFKRGLALSSDFKISKEELQYALDNFVKEVGLDNSMNKFINSITDKDHLLKLMNKYPL
jgi:hypothetical protein